MKQLAPAVLFLACIGTAGPHAADPRPEGDVEAVAPGVYALVGADTPGLLPRANSVFIINGQDALIVDPGGSELEARARLAALRTLTRAPVRYIVETHGDDDHALGNSAVRAAFRDVEIIGHVATAAAAFARKGRPAGGRDLPATIAKLEQALRSGIGLDGAPLSGPARALVQIDRERAMAAVRAGERSPLPPTVPVTERLTLRRGDRMIEILSFGTGHSDGDLVVYLPNERVLIAGDLVTWPALYASDTTSLAGWVRALTGLRQLDVDVIVPGHGAIMHGWEKADRLRALLTDLERDLATAPAATPAAARWRAVLAAETPLGGVLFDRFTAGAALTRR